MKKVDQGVYRMVDANLHRAAEGLRVLMDIARFVCDDKTESGRFKAVRHGLFEAVESLPEYYSKAVQSRDADDDVGRSVGAGAMGLRRDLPDLYLANLHRSQEALRTLEECAKLIAPSVGARLENLRFTLYSIDKAFLPTVLKSGSESLMDFQLYVVTDQSLSRGRDFVTVVENAIDGGAGAIQLRAKHLGKRELLAVARDIRTLTQKHGVTFFINDHLDIALACEADGCHLGQDDFPIDEARRIVGTGFLLGASTHNVEQALYAEAQGASYVNVGPVFATKTKETSCAPVGVELITRVKERLKIPQTCMGGINSSNVHEVILAGAERVAVVSAVVAADDVKAAARNLLEQISQAKQKRGDV